MIEEESFNVVNSLVGFWLSVLCPTLGDFIMDEKGRKG